MIEVWITKYALTNGIFRTEARVEGGMAVSRNTDGYSEYYHGQGKDWHFTYPDAVQRAWKMRDDRIASLKKQIAKLEKLKFEPTEQSAS